MTEKVDHEGVVAVLVVMKEAAEDVVSGDIGLRLLRAAECVAELIAADKAFDVCRAHKIQADNRIFCGERTGENYRRQVDAHHAYDRALERRRAALSRLEPHP